MFNISKLFSSVLTTKTRKICFGVISSTTTLWLLHYHPLFRSKNLTQITETSLLPFRVAHADEQKKEEKKTEERIKGDDFNNLHMRIKELEEKEKEYKTQATELQKKKDHQNKKNENHIQYIQKLVQTIKSESELQNKQQQLLKEEKHQKYLQKLKDNYYLKSEKMKQELLSVLEMTKSYYENNQKTIFDMLEVRHNINLEKFLEQQEMEIKSRFVGLNQTISQQKSIKQNLQKELNHFHHHHEKHLENLENRRKKMKENIKLTQDLFQLRKFIQNEEFSEKEFFELKKDTEGIPLLRDVLEKAPLGAKSVSKLEEEFGNLRRSQKYVVGTGGEGNHQKTHSQNREHNLRKTYINHKVSKKIYTSTFK